MPHRHHKSQLKFRNKAEVESINKKIDELSKELRAKEVKEKEAEPSTTEVHIVPTSSGERVI